MILSFCFVCILDYLYSFGKQATEVVTEKAKEITKTVEEKVKVILHMRADLRKWCLRHSSNNCAGLQIRGGKGHFSFDFLGIQH